MATDGSSFRSEAWRGGAVPVLQERPAACVAAPIPGGTLDPRRLPKFQTPLLIPPVMPKAGTITLPGGKPADYYEISMRQFAQQILPAGLPATTVWGYGAVKSAQQEWPAPPQRPFAHDRGAVEQAGARQVDQRPRGRERQLPAAPAAGRPDAALGQPAGRHRRTATRGPTFDEHARPLHRPGPDRDARPRRRRRRRRERRLRRGVVPARGEQHPGRLRHRGHLVRLLRGQGRGELRRHLGARLRHLPVPEREPRLDHLVPRPHAGHDAAQRVRRPGRLLHHPRRSRGRQGRARHRARARPPCCPARRPRRATSSRPTRPTTRSRSPSRTARSTRTGRSSIRTRASSSTELRPARLSSRTPTSRRSGTPSSSAT